MPDAATALFGAGHILAEQFSEDPELRQRVRKMYRKSGKLVSTKVEDNPKKNQQFHDYLDFREPLHRIPPHRVLAINRGERAKVLRVRVDADEAAIETLAIELLVPENHAHKDFLTGCVRDALVRLLLPSLEREARRELTEERRRTPSKSLPAICGICCCNRRCTASECWRSIRATRTAASWRCSTNSARCWFTT